MSEQEKPNVLEDVRRWLVEESSLCDCFARCSNECSCGAWDGWKTVSMPDLINRFDERFPNTKEKG